MIKSLKGKMIMKNIFNFKKVSMDTKKRLCSILHTLLFISMIVTLIYDASLANSYTKNIVISYFILIMSLNDGLTHLERKYIDEDKRINKLAYECAILAVSTNILWSIGSLITDHIGFTCLILDVFSSAILIWIYQDDKKLVIKSKEKSKKKKKK